MEAFLPEGIFSEGMDEPKAKGLKNKLRKSPERKCLCTFQGVSNIFSLPFYCSCKQMNRETRVISTFQFMLIAASAREYNMNVLNRGAANSSSQL